MKKLISITVVLSLIFTLFVPFTVLADDLKLENGYYIIDSGDDFLKINDMTAKYKITKDVEIPENFTPIGTRDDPFKGKLVGRLDGKTDKPTVTVNLESSRYTGIIGYMEGGSVENIILKGQITSSGNISGSFVGYAKNGVLSDLVNYAGITVVYSGSNTAYIGGIAGYIEAADNFKIDTCENYGNITFENENKGAVGGIIGGMVTNLGKITNCKNDGEIKTKAKYAGGIAGISYCPITFSANFGNISSSNYAAGICPQTTMEITHSFNKGNIITSDYAGGISVNGKCNVTYNTGDILAKETSPISLKGKYTYSYTTNGKLADGNYYLDNSDSSEFALTDEELTNIDNLKGYNEFYRIDYESEYNYPQIEGNVYGTLPKIYPEFINNRIIAEAEDCEFTTYEKVANPSAYGGYTVQPIRGYAVSDNTKIEDAGFKYEFYLPSEKRVFVWVRAHIKSEKGDTAWTCYDDLNWYKCTFSAIDYTQFKWYKVVGNKLPEGVHTFKLFPRENIMEIDRILVTDTAFVTPEGSGEYTGEQKDEIFYSIPTRAPQVGKHPRILFTEEDVAKIRENMMHPEHSGALAYHKSLLEKESDGILPTPADATQDNYNIEDLAKFKAHAFEYAINKDSEHGKKAVQMAKNYLNTLVLADGSDYAQTGRIIYGISMVYDWCYDLLTEEDKTFFIDTALFLAGAYLEIGWPPVKQEAWGGHGAEDQFMKDLTALGIATYDEKPYIYNTVVGRLEDEYISPRRDYLFVSHKSPYTQYYGMARSFADLSAMLLLDNIYDGNFWQSDDFRYIAYWYIYGTRPDGLYIADGDGRYSQGVSPKELRRPTFLYFGLGNYFKDGYLKYMVSEEIEDLVPDWERYLEYLIINDPDLEPISKHNLPLSYYFPYPAGQYLVRTGWDDGKNSNDVVVQLSVNEAIAYDHNHADAGEFEIYYKGYLATDSGYYQAVRSGENSNMFGTEFYDNYYKQTVAHNCMLVYDPDEPITNFLHNSSDYEIQNSGGQLVSNLAGKYQYPKSTENIKEDEGLNRGKVLGYEHGPDPVVPQYTYLKGDLSGHYSNKISDYERSFMFLNLKEDYPEIPGILIVFDHVVSSNENFKKTYLLHGVNAPEIDGTRTVLKRTEHDYNGKLTNDTLLPTSDNVTITQVGEKDNDFWAGKKNFTTYGFGGGLNEQGGIRTEISPMTPSKEDYFLNVMQMSEPDVEPMKATLIETDTHKGVKIADRVVLFGNTKERLENEVSFSFDGDGEYKITISDLKSGTWNIIKDGVDFGTVVVTEEGTVADFKGKEGDYTLIYKNDNSKKEFVSQERDFVDPSIKIKRNDFLLYCEEKPVMENDRVLVPMRTVAESFGAEVTWDENANTAYFDRYGQTAVITAGSDVAVINGVNTKLDCPAKIINDRLFVPIRLLSEAFHATVGWHDYTRTVTIKDSFTPPPEGYLSVAKVTWYAGELSPHSDGYATIDNNLTTNWGSNMSEPGVKWLLYDFGEVVSLDQVEILWNNPAKRYFVYDLLVSEDGINWVTIKENAQSEVVDYSLNEEFQIVDIPDIMNVRYVKLNAYRNTNHYTININEVRFK